MFLSKSKIKVFLSLFFTLPFIFTGFFNFKLLEKIISTESNETVIVVGLVSFFYVSYFLTILISTITDKASASNKFNFLILSSIFSFSIITFSDYFASYNPSLFGSTTDNFISLMKYYNFGALGFYLLSLIVILLELKKNRNFIDNLNKNKPIFIEKAEWILSTEKFFNDVNLKNINYEDLNSFKLYIENTSNISKSFIYSHLKLIKLLSLSKVDIIDRMKLKPKRKSTTKTSVKNATDWAEFVDYMNMKDKTEENKEDEKFGDFNELNDLDFIDEIKETELDEFEPLTDYSEKESLFESDTELEDFKEELKIEHKDIDSLDIHKNDLELLNQENKPDLDTDKNK